MYSPLSIRLGKDFLQIHGFLRDIFYLWLFSLVSPVRFWGLNLSREKWRGIPKPTIYRFVEGKTKVNCSLADKDTCKFGCVFKAKFSDQPK